MASERKFLQKAISDFEVKQYLHRELSAAGISSIDIQKTPIATRIALIVRRPGMVVGKKGKTITDLSQGLKDQFGVDNPQIEVIEVQNPSLDAQLMAEKIGKQLEVKGHAKSAMRFALKEIMAAGAIGAEIRAAGKLVGKGGKAKSVAVRAGYLKKSGEESKKVRVAHYTAYLKAGAIGITVKIVPPGTIFSDVITLSNLPTPEAMQVQQAADDKAAEDAAASGEVAKSDEAKKEKKPRAKKATTAPRKKKETSTEKEPAKAEEKTEEAKE